MLPEFNRFRRRPLARQARLCLGLAPLTLYLVALTLVPVVSTLMSSLQTPQGEWGLGAYRAIVSHYQFGEAVANTLMVTALGLSLELVLGLAAALVLAGGSSALGLGADSLAGAARSADDRGGLGNALHIRHGRLPERGAVQAGVNRSAHRLDR